MMRKPRYSSFILAAAGFALIGRLIFQGGLWISYEVGGNMNGDASIYRAVATGIANGLVPYRDLFETKPPGIFWLYALSARIGSRDLLLLALEIVCVVFISLTPALFFILQKRGSIKTIMLALLYGGLIGLYAGRSSGGFQVELYGAGVLMAYVLLAARPDNGKISWKKTTVLSLALFLAAGLKEPFLLTALSVSLLFADSLNGLIKTFFIPLTAALIAGITALFVSGMAVPYFRIYLPFMFGTRVSSPWMRGLFFPIPLFDLDVFATFLGSAALLLAVYHITRPPPEGETLSSFFSRIARLSLTYYLPTLAVGLGGEYYDHQMVFAVPFLIALFIRVFADLKADRSVPRRFIIGAVPLLVAAAVVFIHPLDYDGYPAILARDEQRARSDAAYIDEVLSVTGQERYLYAGINGTAAYGYTKHSPYGPAFASLPVYYQHGVPLFIDGFRRALKTTGLIVVDTNYPGLLAVPEFSRYLDEHFAATPPARLLPIKRGQRRYRIYFRKR